jgi:hypothetical protein
MPTAISKRFPDRRSIVNVFSAAVFVTYGWTMVQSFWKMPSWLFFLGFGDIIGIYSYAFVINFIESISLLLAVILPGLVLPRRFWNETLTARGVVLSFVVVCSALLHQNTYRTLDLRAEFVNGQLAWWGVTLLIGLVIAWLASAVQLLRTGLEDLADRFTIFLYVYLPLTALGFIVVFARIIL